jgi:DNA-binding CsgD family transcriptional regulator
LTLFALRALAGVVFDRAEALSGREPHLSVPRPPPALSARERECLLHLIDGRSTAFIARAMDMTEVTVRFHSRYLKAKTGATNRAQLTALAIAQGLAPR